MPETKFANPPTGGRPFLVDTKGKPLVPPATAPKAKKKASKKKAKED